MCAPYYTLQKARNDLFFLNVKQPLSKYFDISSQKNSENRLPRNSLRHSCTQVQWKDFIFVAFCILSSEDCMFNI